MKWLLPVLFFISFGVFAAEPPALYLSWMHDPTTTMVIQWHTPLEQASDVSFRKKGELPWQSSSGTHIVLNGTSILVHTVELTGLSPDCPYEFKVADKVYFFKTLPATLSRPVHIAVGGDAYYFLSPFKKMNRQVARKNPDFVIMGGDLAYAYGIKNPFMAQHSSIKRWLTFLKEWTRDMVAPDGRIIPMLVVLGNHDIRYNPQDPQFQKAPFFQLFALENSIAYRSLNFGDYLNLVLLDTGHRSPIAGNQTQWLEKTLTNSSQFPYKLAAYHVAAYPSVYSPTKGLPPVIRKNWIPVFENHHVQAAFEHHNHAFKRTHKIKQGRVDPEGVMYLGDGCWSTLPRFAHSPSRLWYLSKSKKMNNFWLVTLSPGDPQPSYKAFSLKGQLIDQIN